MTQSCFGSANAPHQNGAGMLRKARRHQSETAADITPEPAPASLRNGVPSWSETRISALLTNFAITWFLMRRSGAVYRLLGKDGSVVASKLVALLLAAIAVSMIRGGLLQMIPPR